MHSTTPWWRSAVIYQVYIRSFADGNGDGVGDIAGLRSRLPYLEQLGVDALWINPWYKSPMADGGYDVADFREIDPLFGTVADTEQLIAEAHRHGIRIIPDIVPNHTSDQHTWFQAALAAGPGSPERERYIFRPGRGPDGAEPPNDWVSCFGGPAWTRLPDGEWYLHLYAPEQPDLNWQHPDVHADFESILRFWFSRGVDGFRIDVAHGLVKDPELPDLPPLLDSADGPRHHIQHPHWDRDEVHAIYRTWRKVADEFEGDRCFVAEAWADTPERLAAYVRPGGLHTAFNFDFLMASWDAKDLRAVIDDSLAMLHAVGAPATWVLSNHDVMRHTSRYARKTVARWVPNERYQPEGNVDLELGTRRARAAALLMLALPGGAYLYQGDELGLPEVEDLPESVLQDPIWERSGHTDHGRDGCRVPLPWSGQSAPFGFSPENAPAEPWLPQPANWGKRSVEAQTGDESSMLELYRTALRIRRENPALGDGTMTWLDAPSGVLSFRRDPGFVCVVNLSTEPYRLPDHTSILLASGPVTSGLLAPPPPGGLARGIGPTENSSFPSNRQDLPGVTPRQSGRPWPTRGDRQRHGPGCIEWLTQDSVRDAPSSGRWRWSASWTMPRTHQSETGESPSNRTGLTRSTTSSPEPLGAVAAADGPRLPRPGRPLGAVGRVDRRGCPNPVGLRLRA